MPFCYNPKTYNPISYNPISYKLLKTPLFSRRLYTYSCTSNRFLNYHGQRLSWWVQCMLEEYRSHNTPSIGIKSHLTRLDPQQHCRHGYQSHIEGMVQKHTVPSIISLWIHSHNVQQTITIAIVQTEASIVLATTCVHSEFSEANC